MQIVIDIPDGYVKVIKANQRTEGSAMDKMIRQAVIDGTPLPKGHGALEEEPVLDKIRAEMADLASRTMNDNRASGMWTCIDILDKYKRERKERGNMTEKRMLVKL